MKGCVCVPVRTPWRVVSEGGVCVCLRVVSEGVCVSVRTPWRVVSEGVCVCVCACQDTMESC